MAERLYAKFLPGRFESVDPTFREFFVDTDADSSWYQQEVDLPPVVPHPAATDFGLDTLTGYLQNELKDHGIRERKRTSDRSLARAEAEKENIRKFVISNQPIDARIHNGQLEVRHYTWHGHKEWVNSNSTSTSEDEIESHPKRLRSTPATQGISGTAHHSRASGDHSVKSTSSVQALSQSPSLPQSSSSQSSNTNNLIGISGSASKTFLPQPRHFVHLSPEELRSELQYRVSNNEITESYAADITACLSERLDQTRTGVCSCIDEGCLHTILVKASSAEEIMPSGPRAGILKDATNVGHAQASNHSCLPNSPRSLSFEHHANEVRQAHRHFHVRDLRRASSAKQNDNSSKIRGSSCGEKSDGAERSFCFDPNDPAYRSSVLDTRGLPVSNNIHQAQRMQIDSLEESLPGQATAADPSLVGIEAWSGADHFPNIRSAVDLCQNMQQDGDSSSVSSLNTRRLYGKRFGEEKKFLYKDTFQSNTDDTVSGSDNDVNIDLEGSSDEGKLSRVASDDHDHKEDNNAKRLVTTVFDYSTIVPELLPPHIFQARENCRVIWNLLGLSHTGHPDSSRSKEWPGIQFSMDDLDPDAGNILATTNSLGFFPRRWEALGLPTTSRDPPTCVSQHEKPEISPEILTRVCQYLSSQELRNLRLVNKAIAATLLPLMIRSTVIKFGKRLFDATDGSEWDYESDKPAPTSILQSMGHEINKFGISFEFDPTGLANAEAKQIEDEISAWFGKYIWPKKTYPYFPPLKEQEDFVDNNRRLLKNTMSTLTKVHELALCVDSGYGWLPGPDISDMALLRQQRQGGTEVFGKTFNAQDKWHEFALRQFFKWGQSNTINALAKRLAYMREGTPMIRAERRFLRRLRIREYDEYQVQDQQPDYNPHAHTGGVASPPVVVQVDPTGQAATASAAPPVSTLQQMAVPVQAHPAQAGFPALPPPVIVGPIALPSLAFGGPFPMPNAFANTVVVPANAPANPQPNAFIAATGVAGTANPPLTSPPSGYVHAPNGPPAGFYAAFPQPPPPLPPALAPYALARRGPRLSPHDRRIKALNEERSMAPIVPQWPLLFNCHNMSAQVGGNQAFIQDQVSSPADFPYMPGELNETQVQWLTETLWAQRVFLAAYVNSIISNAGVFKNVHSLHITKLSSGLMQSIAVDEFWSSLPDLRTLTLKISPDWRREHVPGDKRFYRNMSISPLQASVGLATLLKTYIVKIESLSTLRIGFVGGGEHQTGLFGRNRHVLPAPITTDPQAWVTCHAVKPDPDTMFSFNHIRDLTFENCWFSPYMLETLMIKSKDSSLHYLTLDSVSLTGVHDEVSLRQSPLTTELDNLRCVHEPAQWLHEIIPPNACWVNVLEKITPGKTILERKYDAEMIDEEKIPRPAPEFRGHVKKIILKSVGYVKIGGIKSDQFKQSGLVVQSEGWTALDDGLEMRKKLFYVSTFRQPPPQAPLNSRFRPVYPRGNENDNSNEATRACIMINNKDPRDEVEYFGLGKLTQCVHPIEKRVLEQAWGMTFGWGNTMERWAAVEDGWFEGGTGRFSGTINKE